MKINFTKKEYDALIDMIYMAMWVANSHKVGSEDGNDIYKAIEQKIYSLAKQFSKDDQIEYSKDLDEYYPTQEYDECSKPRDLITEFETDTFWAELINRLAERDALDESGKASFQDIEFEKRIELITKHEHKWADEFEKNGIKRIKVDD